MKAYTTTIGDLLTNRGLFWFARYARASLTANATALVGFVTGDYEVVFPSRFYSSTGNKLSVGLYETTFSGGAVLTPVNRRLSSAMACPVSWAGDVAASLGAVITSATILASAATGNAQAGLTGDQNRYVLKANTSYVVGLLNESSGAADVTAGFNFFEMKNFTTVTEGI